VYVIQSRPKTPFKVGVAVNVEARLRTLQTGNPQLLRIHCVVPGDHHLEHQFHRRLVDARVTGEWFAGPVAAEFRRYIRDLADRMVDAYGDDGEAPAYWRLDPELHKPGPPGMTVRFVEPNPRIDPEEAQRMRESVRGMSRSAYLGPPSAIVRSRTPGAARYSPQYRL